MEDTSIVLMVKDNKTGFLEKEIGSYKIDENENLVVSAFVLDDKGNYEVHLKISIDRDIEDWEFNAIYDYYDDENIKNLVTSINEIEDCYNPTWEVTFDFVNSSTDMEEKIKSILACHKTELLDTYAVIKDKEQEYRGLNL